MLQAPSYLMVKFITQARVVATVHLLQGYNGAVVPSSEQCARATSCELVIKGYAVWCKGDGVKGRREGVLKK